MTSRHGDVAATIWIVIGAAYWLASPLAQVFLLEPWTVAVLGVAGALLGGWLAAQVRSDLDRREAAAAGALAVPLLLGMYTWEGSVFDRPGLIAMAIGAPPATLAAVLGARLAGLRVIERRWIELGVATAMMSAPTGLVLLVFVAVIEASGDFGLLLTSCFAGGALAAGVIAMLSTRLRFAQVVTGQAIAWATLVLFNAGLRFDGLLVRSTAVLGAAALGAALGQRLRRAPAVASPLPEARIHQEN